MKQWLFILLLFSVFRMEAQVIQIKERLLQDVRPDMDLETDSFIPLQLFFTGNIYQPEQQIAACYDAQKNQYDFRDQLKYVQPILNLGDLVLGSLKTHFLDQPDNPFSTPDAFALALKYAGIQVLADADGFNAYVDKVGLQRTRDLLDKMDMQLFGVYPDNYTRLGNYPLIINRKGFRIALLNYTEVINNRSSVSRDVIINQTDRSLLEMDLRMARVQNPDFIVLFIDWGMQPGGYNQQHAHDLSVWCMERGVDLVVGSHKNKVLPIDPVDFMYGGKEKQGVIAYSLGNLIGADPKEENRSGYLLEVMLQKNKYTGVTRMQDFGIIPVYQYYDSFTTPGKIPMYVVPCSNVEDGSLLPKMPYLHKRKTVNAAFEMRKMLGVAADEVRYNMTEENVAEMAEFIQITQAPLNNRMSMARPEMIQAASSPVARQQVEILQDTLYRIQFYMLKRPIPLDTNYYTHLKGYEMVKENGYYYYYLMSSSSLKEVHDHWLRQMRPRYKQSMVVAFYQGRRVREITEPLPPK